MKIMANQNGFTYILALTIVMIMGIMLGMVGQSWKTISQREKEKELLFRGSQIKEAIENWNKLNTVPGVQRRTSPQPLMDLKDLLQDPYSLTKIKFLPQSYAAEVDDTNPKCAPDCAKLKIYQDPMTGKEWTIIRGIIGLNGQPAPVLPGTQGADIIGVASKSDETPFRTDFKDTALENLITKIPNSKPKNDFETETPPQNPGSKTDTYSEWQFIADPNNDHTKIYRAYHEGW